VLKGSSLDEYITAAYYGGDEEALPLGLALAEKCAGSFSS
jgi:hypothetical protein